ncbi:MULTISPECIES: hypothetical protein [unclassified Pseudomonas]|uniref:hypothetical protein n=1 Tax=unclassified Pseudomonas TaxID=196821 RepID=UPI00117A0F33|nr:hypothetical protein [Pseudomonas sp. 1239]
MSATYFNVHLQNEMEGKINYFHYKKVNDRTTGTKSPLTSPQTIYDFNLYPGGRFIATTADSLIAPPEEPETLRFKLTNNSDFKFYLIELDTTDGAIMEWLNSDGSTKKAPFKLNYTMRQLLPNVPVTLEVPNGSHWYVGEVPDRGRA